MLTKVIISTDVYIGHKLSKPIHLKTIYLCTANRGREIVLDVEELNLTSEYFDFTKPLVLVGKSDYQRGSLNYKIELREVFVS